MDRTAEYFLKLDFTLQLAHNDRIKPGARNTKYMGSNMGIIKRNSLSWVSVKEEERGVKAARRGRGKLC